MRRFALTVAVLLVTAGCGGDEGGGARAGSAPSDEREAVVEATRAYQGTVLDADAEGLCARLTGAGKQELIATAAALGGPASCPESAQRVFDLAGEDDRQRIKQSADALSPSDVRVRAGAATVTLPESGRKLGLRKAGDEWLISSPGLRRR